MRVVCIIVEQQKGHQDELVTKETSRQTSHERNIKTNFYSTEPQCAATLIAWSPEHEVAAPPRHARWTCAAQEKKLKLTKN
jgi:hypothetical protein